MSCVYGKQLGEPVAAVDWETEKVSQRRRHFCWFGGDEQESASHREEQMARRQTHHTQKHVSGEARGTLGISGNPSWLEPKVGYAWMGDEASEGHLREVSCDKFHIFHILTSWRRLKVQMSLIGRKSWYLLPSPWVVK